MRKLKVRHVPLPGIGELFEILAASGLSVRVVSQRSGKRELSVGPADDDSRRVSVSLTRTESSALAALLVGAQIELVTERD